MLKRAEQRLISAHSQLNQPAGRTVQVRCFQMTENNDRFWQRQGSGGSAGVDWTGNHAEALRHLTERGGRGDAAGGGKEGYVKNVYIV